MFRLKLVNLLKNKEKVIRLIIEFLLGVERYF